MKNGFVHCELNTSNVKKAHGFYQKLFAWKIAAYPGMDYLGVDTGEKNRGGGIQQSPMPEAPNAWLPYVQVASVKNTLAKAKKLGAKIVMPHTDLQGMGAIGIFVDPTGAGLGVYEPAKKRAKKR